MKKLSPAMVKVLRAVGAYETLAGMFFVDWYRAGQPTAATREALESRGLVESRGLSLKLTEAGYRALRAA